MEIQHVTDASPSKPIDTTKQEPDVGRVARRSAFRALVQDFGPIWFTWCMNAGALAQLIANCPYRFTAIDILADIFFMKAILMYVVFTSIFLTRLLWFKSEAYNEIVNSIVELTFVPCWDIAFMTLTGGVGLIVSNASWGGYPFTIVAYVMWWFVGVWNISALYWAFCSVTRREVLTAAARIPSSILIPAVSLSTVAVTGGSLATYAYDLPDNLAIPMMMLSFYWVGGGVLLGFILTVYLIQDLVTKGWPDPEQTATIFLLVGPMGQSAAALQILGSAANPPLNRFGNYNAGTFITAQSAQGLLPACILFALMLNGLGIIYLILGIWLVINRARQGQLKWALSWNAAVFPNSTLTTSFIVFSEQLDSPAYRVLSCIMIVILVAVYLTNLGFALMRIWQGRLLVVRDDWRIQARREEEQKNR